MSGIKVDPLVPVAVGLVVAGTALRLVPHPANFAPAMAVAIFAGSVLPRKLALAVPLLTLALSDFIIGMYDWRIMASVWACYGIVALMSSHMLRKPSILQGAAFTMASSCFFFIVTNFMVWTAGGMYAYSWRGLRDCYIMALPFFRNTFLSDMAYVAILFVCWRLSQEVAGKLHRALPEKPDCHD